LIVFEALLLAVVGFLPGTLASFGLYHWLADQTGLLMQMTTGSMLFVLAATIAMCIASGMLAVRKLLAADPANLF
jgi:putative ABC transport system permease protein